MSMITLNIPDQLDLDPDETIKLLASKLYVSGRLSLVQTAEITRLSTIAFTEIIGDFGVSLVNHPISKILGDAANI